MTTNRCALLIIGILFCFGWQMPERIGAQTLRPQRSLAAQDNERASTQTLKTRRAIKEVNQTLPPETKNFIAIEGATLIDVNRRMAIPDSIVIVREGKIIAAGARQNITIPRGADIVDARGQTLLPGLIDAHFHIDGDDELPTLYLTHGITSVRDPGQWIEAYDVARRNPRGVPRLFLTGPHLDSPPPAYPADSIMVRDREETTRVVTQLVDQGATAIKVYFRLPLDLIRTAIAVAHQRGVPVTSHLEIVRAVDAINEGVDGIEHVTSLGSSLVPLREAEKYRQAVLANNDARKEGRYAVWNSIDLKGARATALINLIIERHVFLSPTLAIFERRTGDPETTDVHVKGFQQMLSFVGQAHRAGVHVVVGSHSSVPHAERGWAYQRELELLVESGLSPMDALVAGTMENARFFRSESRLGSIEAGKQADIVLVAGDPLKDISAMRRISRVMLNGRWVTTDTTK